MAQEVILYTGKMCSDCEKLKTYMVAQGIVHEVRNISEDPAYAKEVEENTGKLGVPYLVIDGEWVCGYDTEHPFSDEFAASLFSR